MIGVRTDAFGATDDSHRNFIDGENILRVAAATGSGTFALFAASMIGERSLCARSMVKPAEMSPFITLVDQFMRSWPLKAVVPLITSSVFSRSRPKRCAFYTSVGIGPWVDYPSFAQYTQLEVPNLESFLATTYKYANLENIQIQLCQPGNGASPQRQFLETRGEGVFHLGFSVPDCDGAESTAQSLGLKVLMKGRRKDGTGFSYFDTVNRGAAVTLEVRSSPKS